MVEQLVRWDTRLFLELNQHHAPWMDAVMYWVTDTWFWYPMYAVLAGLVVWRYRTPGLLMVLAAILAVGLADFLTSSVMKPYFGRLRPCHTVEIQKSVYVLRGCGGQFGFASSHASTTFALAASLFMLAGRRLRGLVWLFPWAALVSYSRIYVGVHYPLDILTGAGVGVLCAWTLVRLYRRILRGSRFAASDNEPADTAPD